MPSRHPRTRGNRLLVALIAAWMAISIAIGSVSADHPDGTGGTANTQSGATP